MKVVVSSTGPDLSSATDPRFGRCSYFVLVDSDSMETKSYPNESQTAMGGAGIQAGQFVSSLGAEAVITGNVGPNAARVLGASGMKIYTGAAGTAEKAVNDFKAGKLKEVSSATVGPPFGMGGGR
ncbi:MAG: NifB/NifX family molybdenum-iron cluster-binding protein [PVC group bacterium]